MVALCIRLRRCDGNLYWLQNFIELRSVEEHEFRIKHWQFHFFRLHMIRSLFVWISKFVVEWKILITRTTQKCSTPKWLQQSTQSSTQKSFFHFCSCYFSLFISLFLDWITCFFVTWRHLFKLVKVLYSLFLHGVWAVGIQFTINDFKSVSDFLSLFSNCFSINLIKQPVII